MDNLKIGQYIQNLRKAKGMSQRQLADQLNISFQAVSKWENGESVPDTGILLELCEVLETTVEKLLNGGTYALNQRKVMRVEDVMEGFRCMEMIGKCFGEHSTFYEGMVEGINKKMNIDLLEYLKQHEEIENAPIGIHAVVASGTDAPPGVLFVLKNINESVNIDHRNRVHPFYMVYISSEGEIVRDYLDPKKLLDTFRFLCKGKSEADITLCSAFNKETKDGRDMSEISELLSESISSILDVKEESDIDSLFKAGGTSALVSDVSGLDDFELICFLVVR